MPKPFVLAHGLAKSDVTRFFEKFHYGVAVAQDQPQMLDFVATDLFDFSSHLVTLGGADCPPELANDFLRPLVIDALLNDEVVLAAIEAGDAEHIREVPQEYKAEIAMICLEVHAVRLSGIPSQGRLTTYVFVVVMKPITTNPLVSSPIYLTDDC